MEGGVKEETLPPGFRFHPTDEELISYYLTNKISDANFTGRAITDVDLNKCEPWDLPGKAKMGEKEWYFFSLRDRKYPTGLRTNRATDAGYWKTTGKDKEIFNSVTSELTGMKKTLVFYRGRAPKGEKTNWVMHEYRLQPKTAFKTTKDEWVVCRVFQKSSGVKKFPPAQARPNPYNLEVGPPSMSSLLQHQPNQFSIARMNNVDLAELTRVMRGPGNTNLQSQQQLGYPPGFSFPGLNLNLPSSMPVVRTFPVTFNQQPAAMDASSSLMNGCILATDTCFGTELNQTGNSRFHPVDPCVDLENYWPTY